MVVKGKNGSWVRKEEAPETREGVEMEILEAKETGAMVRHQCFSSHSLRGSELAYC